VLSCDSNEAICIDVAQLTTHIILHGVLTSSEQNTQFHNVVNEFGKSIFENCAQLNSHAQIVVIEFHNFKPVRLGVPQNTHCCI
jgi:hypothetical protein